VTRRQHRRRVDADANVHQSFTISGDASRDTKNHGCESAAAILAKIRFWRAAMRRKGGSHENFFIAKNRDSESAQRTFRGRRRVATAPNASRSIKAESRKRLRCNGFLYC
jgi:hypothetical protein